MALRWGIACAGQICNDFLAAMHTLPAGEHEVVAVAARDLSRAKKFAQQFHIPVAYDNYAQLAANKEVEIVYVGSVCTQHFEMAKMFLNQNKHVLCEKPLTLNSKQTIELCEQAKSKGLFFMEAVWSRFFPVYEYIRKLLADGAIGDIIQVSANMTIAFPEDHNVRVKSQGGGTVLDFGVYVLQFALLVLGPHMPCEVRAVGHVNKTGCDEGTAIILKYPANRMAVLGTSALADMNNDAYIWGTKGHIRVIDPFWCPTKVEYGTEIKEFPLPQSDHPLFNRNSTGLRFEVAEVKRCIRQGLIECPLFTHQESITIAKIQDEVRHQIRVSLD